MKFVLISDTHGRHFHIKNLPPGDVIIHAGDITTNGNLFEVINFLHWFSALKYKYKILIAGNHDRYLESISKTKAEKDLFKNGVYYLNDSGIDLAGIRIWGTPVQPEHNNWAFNKKRGKEIKKHWDLIPNNVDILITHGPSHGFRDYTHNKLNVGCWDLHTKLSTLKPKYHVFGHVHESYGTIKDKESGVIHINASLLDREKKLSNKPLSITISPKVLTSRTSVKKIESNQPFIKKHV